MGSGPVLVIGESLVDIIRHPNGDTFEAPGGSPMNVAVTLARLGVETSLLTALSSDSRSDRIIDHLIHSGVTLVHGTRRLSRTSTATAAMLADGSARYEFDLTWDPPPYVGPVARIVHAGSLALFLQPGAARVRRLLEEVSGTSLVSLDPNIRPSLLPDLGVVRPMFEELLSLASVVKLSDEDASWLYPGITECDVVGRLLAAGPALVALTRGGGGCVLASADDEVSLPAVPTEVADTIGAGDSYMGGLLRQILVNDLIGSLVAGQALNSADLTALGTAAAKVAAVTVSRRGADPPWASELGDGSD